MSQLPQPQPGPVLQYSPPVPGRPGILTAIGVVSVVIGSLSMLYGAMTGFSYAMIYFMASRTPMVVTTTTVTSPLTTIPTSTTATSITPPTMPFASNRPALLLYAMSSG